MTVYDEHAGEYDRWFEENELVYQAEITALRTFVPSTGAGLEVGIGTGRFAVPLSVEVGIDPAKGALQMARRRGIAVCQAFGEAIPFQAGYFDFAMLVTVDPFVPDVGRLLNEIWRILKPNGRLILGVIDKSSPLGQLYETHKDSDRFYREAHFHTADEIITYLQHAGFEGIEACQTISGLPITVTGTEHVQNGYDSDALKVQDGFGAGAFVALKAVKAHKPIAF